MVSKNKSHQTLSINSRKTTNCSHNNQSPPSKRKFILSLQKQSILIVILDNALNSGSQNNSHSGMKESVGIFQNIKEDF
jgi:hypothetical protein